MLGANDIAASRRFYDATLGALGISPGREDDNGRVFYRSASGVFALSRPIDGQSACGANGGTLGFAASSCEAIDAWHEAGLTHGGATCEDPPGVREGMGMRLYLAYLRDPAGNKLCAAYRLPA